MKTKQGVIGHSLVIFWYHPSFHNLIVVVVVERVRAKPHRTMEALLHSPNKDFYICWMLFSVCYIPVLLWLADTGQMAEEQRMNLVVWVCVNFWGATERQCHHRKRTLESSDHGWWVCLTLSVCSGLKCNFRPQLGLFFSVIKQLQQLMCGSCSSFDKNLGNTCRQA